MIPFVLAACDRQPQQVVQQPQVVQQQPQVVATPAPVVVQAAPQNNTGDMLVAGAVGYMMGKSASTPTAAPQPTTINKTVIVNQTSTVAPVAKATTPAPVVTAPVAKPAAPVTAPSTYSYKPSSPVTASRPSTTTSSSSYKPSRR